MLTGLPRLDTRDALHDLGSFVHVHPEPTGRPGELAVELTFPTAGRYTVAFAGALTASHEVVTPALRAVREADVPRLDHLQRRTSGGR